MGHIVSKDGLKPDPDKIKALEEMPCPTSKQEVITLLGFVNYLSKLLPRLSFRSGATPERSDKQRC